MPFGFVLTRLSGKGDIRDIGSGNIGATNVLRTGSKPLAVATLILDCLKATAAICSQRNCLATKAPRSPLPAPFIGHLYPVWLKFHGGKGAATMFGILVALLPIAAGAYAATWLLLLLTFRISSIAGMGAAVIAPMAAFALHSSYLPMLLGFAVLVLWKHRENIFRLPRGTEPRIGRAKG